MSRPKKSDLLKQELLNKKFYVKGKLRIETAHNWARSHPASALHKYLEWDDRKAGYQYRLWQIRRIVDITIGMASSEPVVCNLTIDRNGGGGYRQLKDVLSSKELKAQLMKDAIDELDRIKEKYQMIKQLAGVWGEVDKVRPRAA